MMHAALCPPAPSSPARPTSADTAATQSAPPLTDAAASDESSMIAAALEAVSEAFTMHSHSGPGAGKRACLAACSSMFAMKYSSEASFPKVGG